MPSFEYLVMSFEWASYRLLECRGESALAPDEASARLALRQRLATTMSEEQMNRHREHDELVARHHEALPEWTQRRDDLMSSYQIDVVEETVRKMGTYTVRKERVVLPDGTVRVFDMGKGTAFLERSALEGVGAPPVAPDLEDVSDDEWLDRALKDVRVQVVGRWKGTVEPDDADFDDDLIVGDLRPRSVAELNRLGSQGWKLVDVSEDRTIAGDEAGTSTTVIGVRYTLMREVIA